jgi:hypothetical protein
MPDNYATLNEDEQKYFDTEGAETPQEQSGEKPVVEKAPVAKKTSKAAKLAPEVKAEEAPAEAEVAPEPVKKTAEQEQIDNLNAALRQERAEAKERERRTDDRLRQLQEAMKPKEASPQVQPQEIPDPDKDPMGALKALLAQAREAKQTQTLTAQEVERQQQTQRIMGDASRMEYEYLATLPDYDANSRVSPTYNEASAYLVNMRRAELNAIGSYNPMQINQMISQEAIGLAAQAIQGGRNPAQVVMEIAKARGFAPKAKVQAVETPAETEQEKITRIAKGQEAGFSLGQAAGGRAPNNSKLDAKSIANMSDEAFQAFVDKAKKSELRAIMGD